MTATVKTGERGLPGADSQFDAFLFRLDPSDASQFGYARSSSANLPTATAMTDTDGRPFIRYASTLDTASKMMLCLDDDGVRINARGRFRIDMRARWAGVAAGQIAGVCFNCDRVGSLLTCFGVGNVAADGSHFDSLLSGVPEGQAVNNAAVSDASVDWAALHVDVWLDVTTGYCTYQYGPVADALGIGLGKQRRKTALLTAADSGLGIYTTGAIGHLDIAELTVIRNERDW